MARKASTRSGTKRRREAPADGIVAMLRGLARDLLDPYRPELHYMRGPGPKWRAKHAPSVEPVPTPSMREAAI